LADLFDNLIALFGILISQNQHSVQAHNLRGLFVCGFQIYTPDILVSRICFSCLDSRIMLPILSIFRAWVQT